MDGEQAPLAPAPASEANQLQNAEVAATPATPAQPAITPNIPADQVETFNKFISANGGFEKAFSKLKNDVSNPAPAQPAPAASYVQPQQQPQQPQYQQQQQPVQSYQANDIPQGYITQEEFAIQQYFGSLANDPTYAPIADQIRSGEVLREMAKYNIRPAANGMFNDSQVRSFLGLLAKTVPAPTPATPMTNTPTVDYVAAGDTITSQDEALSILNQNIDLRSRGLPLHPRTEEAEMFVKNMFNR